MDAKRSLTLLAVALAALSASGCALLLVGAGAAAGAGTVAYLQGELKTNQDAPLDKVLKATDATLKEMKLTVLERTEGIERAKLTARVEADKRVEITLTRLTPKATSISIRVGVFGDEPLSRQILEKILKRL